MESGILKCRRRGRRGDRWPAFDDLWPRIDEGPLVDAVCLPSVPLPGYRPVFVRSR